MRKAAFALAFVLLALPAAAQDVKVGQVNDRRSSGSFAHLMIYLELPKFRNADVTASRVLVSAAVDDSGRSLIDSEGREPDLEPNSRGMGREDGPPQPAVVSLTLKSPDRKAKTLKEARGEIELYMPSKDPNSVADIPKFVSLSGKTLSHRALKANGVEIALVSPAQLAAEKKRLGDEKRKSLKEGGYSEEDLDSLVKSYLESLLSVEPADVLLRVKDPNKRIQSISYVDPAGEEKRVSTHDEEGMTILSTWGEKPQPEWKLRVSMKTAKNVVRQPFALTNVPLP